MALIKEGVVDGVEKDEARAGRAFLALVAEGGTDDRGGGFVEVGVIIEDDGVLAA